MPAPTRPPDPIFGYHRPIRASNVWPPPSGVRFVKMYGGELDGHYHPANGWYHASVLDGNLRYLEWIEPQ